MFEQFLGLPAHPLLVHAAVIFGPLLMLFVLVYGLVPRLRARTGWVLVALAVVAPIALWASKLSGDAFRARLAARGVAAEMLARIDVHRELGEKAAYLGTLLGLLALGLVLITAAGRKELTGTVRILTYALIVVSIVVAGATGYFVYEAGETGAQMVWTGE
jgi:hypothetical protein